MSTTTPTCPDCGAPAVGVPNDGGMYAYHLTGCPALPALPSPAAVDDRRPLSPDVLADALQDRIHPASGRLLPDRWFVRMQLLERRQRVAERALAGELDLALNELLVAKREGMVPTVRRALRWFAVEMERELRENDYKPDWLRQPVFESDNGLMSRLVEECAELRQELHKLTENQLSSELRVRIVSEAADVANTAMMIADIYGQRIGAERSQK